MPAGAGRRSRSRSPAPCGCCGEAEGDGVRRRRRRTQARRTASCGCPPDDDAEGRNSSCSRRFWTGSPPRTPPDWRDSFQQLRRRWSDEARRRCTRRGSQDRARPANPSPGEIRALAGRDRPGAQPEYAACGPDPAPWTAEAQAAGPPPLQQRLAELQRWQECTLRVSVEAVEPASGSHFSLAACWDPESAPNTHVSSTGGSPPPCRGTARTSAIGPPTATEPPVSSSTSSSSSGSFHGCGSEESDSGDELEDPLEHVWEEVDEVLQQQPIDKDEARAEVESILRASALSKCEKLAVINAALEDSAKAPEERKETARSMLRRSTRGAREVSEADDPEREVSASQVRRYSKAPRGSRGSRVRSIVEEFEEVANDPESSETRRRTVKKTIVTEDPRKSARVGEDGEGRQSRRGSVSWSRKSTALVPVDSRKTSMRAVASTEDSNRRSEHRQTGLRQKLASVFGKSVRANPKSVYYEAQMAPRPSHVRGTRRSSPWTVDSSALRDKRSSAAAEVFEEDEDRSTRHSTRVSENWSTEARHGSRCSAFDSDESEDNEGTSPRHGSGGRRSTARRGTKVPRESHYRRSTTRHVNDEDDELLPARSLSTRRPTGWARHSSSADTDADELTPRHSGEAIIRSTTVDDTHRHSHRKTSRTHKEPVDARGSRVEGHGGTVSDIEEYSSEEETKKTSSHSSFVEEGDPVERHRWSSRRRDDEDDSDEDGAGAPVSSHRHSGRKSSARRGTYADREHSSHRRKRSNRSGLDEREAEAHCCCVAGDHACYPSSRHSSQYTCVSSDQLSSASDYCCCRSAVSRGSMGYGSSSEECCCCRSLDALPSVARDDSRECTCYCEGRGVSAPEVSHTCKAPARKGGLRKRDLEVEVCCECSGGQETVPCGNAGDTRREVCPGAQPCAAAPCKAALEEPDCLCDRPTAAHGEQDGSRKQRPSWWRGWWRRLLLRYLPVLAAVLLWLFCVWWLCGMLRPLFLPQRCRAKGCPYWRS